MITVTDPAFAQLRALVDERGEPQKGLRIFVESGGCAGMQYGMTLDEVQPGDEIFEQAGVKVIVDPQSLGFLRGATVDYSDDLAGAGFRIHNPNAVRSCGCGTSFEAADTAEAADAAPAQH
jgi:iron-sulfur cluster assembly protein